MKWIFKTTILFILTGCGMQNETDEFVRLEKISANLCHSLDSTEFRNPSQESHSRLSVITDSIFAVSLFYEKKVLNINKSDYSKDFKIVLQKVNILKTNNSNRYINMNWDSILTSNPELDIEFRKASFRTKLSFALNILQGSFCYNAGILDHVDFKQISNFKIKGNNINGQFKVGYVVDGYFDTEITVSNNKKQTKLHLDTYGKANCTLSDTGIYSITATKKGIDSPTGELIQFEKSDSLYVK